MCPQEQAEDPWILAMIKLFLVEDEIVMRDGIKKQINWEKEDIEFVGEASDGELAWPMILETKPDIVLTDIKMPFMDGLTRRRICCSVHSSRTTAR